MPQNFKIAAKPNRTVVPRADTDSIEFRQCLSYGTSLVGHSVVIPSTHFFSMPLPLALFFANKPWVSVNVGLP